MRTLIFPTAVALLVGAAVVAGCSPTPQDGPPSSASPTFSTIPSSPSLSVPAPAPLRADGTADLTLADMVHALSERDVTWSASDVIATGRATISDYQLRAQQCAETGSWFDACGSRDAQRSGLPSRCITEAERRDTMPDFGACGLALLYVHHIGGGK